MGIKFGFTRNITVILDKFIIHYWFSMNLPEDMANNYICTLKINSPDKDYFGFRSSFERKLKAHSSDTPFSNIDFYGGNAVFMYPSLISLWKRKVSGFNGKTFEYKWKFSIKILSTNQD